MARTPERASLCIAGSVGGLEFSEIASAFVHGYGAGLGVEFCFDALITVLARYFTYPPGCPVADDNQLELGAVVACRYQYGEARSWFYCDTCSDGQLQRADSAAPGLRDLLVSQSDCESRVGFDLKRAPGWDQAWVGEHRDRALLTGVKTNR